MDENASRAVFLGVSVFVAIITITLIVGFYRTAKDSAAVANRYDLTNTGNKRADEILCKIKITGLELRYLLNYYYNESSIEIVVYQSFGDSETNQKLNINTDNYWSEENQLALDEKIRPNYNYVLTIVDDYKVVAIFEN